MKESEEEKVCLCTFDPGLGAYNDDDDETDSWFHFLLQNMQKEELERKRFVVVDQEEEETSWTSDDHHPRWSVTVAVDCTASNVARIVFTTRSADVQPGPIAKNETPVDQKKKK